MEKVSLPDMEQGQWRVEKFTTVKICWASEKAGRHVPVGQTFTRLLFDGQLLMSDTPAEQNDHRLPIIKATGDCMLHGLGLGLVLKNILLKPEVQTVTVIESSQTLIDLIAPHYSDPRVVFINADALTYKPPKCQRYHMVWSDIWPTITMDNLKTMGILHRKYGKRADWHGCWCHYECLRLKRKHNERINFLRQIGLE